MAQRPRPKCDVEAGSSPKVRKHKVLKPIPAETVMECKDVKRVAGGRRPGLGVPNLVQIDGCVAEVGLGDRPVGVLDRV